MSRAMNGPYPGARPFRQEDREWFFGCAAEAATLAQSWQANRLTVAFGPGRQRKDFAPSGWSLSVNYGQTF